MLPVRVLFDLFGGSMSLLIREVIYFRIFLDQVKDVFFLIPASLLVFFLSLLLFCLSTSSTFSAVMRFCSCASLLPFFIYCLFAFIFLLLYSLLLVSQLEP